MMTTKPPFRRKALDLIMDNNVKTSLLEPKKALNTMKIAKYSKCEIILLWHFKIMPIIPNSAKWLIWLWRNSK